MIHLSRLRSLARGDFVSGLHVLRQEVHRYRGKPWLDPQGFKGVDAQCGH